VRIVERDDVPDAASEQEVDDICRLELVPYGPAVRVEPAVDGLEYLVGKEVHMRVDDVGQIAINVRPVDVVEGGERVAEPAEAGVGVGHEPSS